MTFPTNEGMEVHWYFTGTGSFQLCEEYVTGDDVIDHDKALVTCPECLEWMHA